MFRFSLTKLLCLHLDIYDAYLVAFWWLQVYPGMPWSANPNYGKGWYHANRDW